MAALVQSKLNAESRDLQRVALEPGLPMLDFRSNAGQVLKRWLGDLVAEAEWHGGVLCDL